MALASTLYRFKIELSDVERSVYETLDLRLAMHPSESEEFLLTRLLAYALNYEEGLGFSEGGLSSPEDPAIRLLGPHGQILKWIDIGNPTARRLHKAAKAAAKVRVYTYKNPENLKKEAAGAQIHRAELVEVFALEPSFLAEIGGALKRDNAWAVIHQQGELVITAGEQSFVGAIAAHRLV